MTYLKRTHLILILLNLVSFQALAQNTQNYRDLKSSQKVNFLWSEIIKSQYDLKKLPSNPSFSGAVVKLLNPTYLSTSFTEASDFMPKSRIKFIHAVGSVALFKFVPSPNKYTGIFSTGGAGLLRLSLAASEDSLKSYTPGMALKFFVENQNSKNLFAMNSLDGQGEDRNPFSKNFSTDIEKPKSFILKMLSLAFSKVKSDPTILPIDHLSKFTQSGEIVSNSAYPYSLIFKPMKRNLIAADSKDDLRIQLSRVLEDEEIYEVFAVDKIGSVPASIGKILTESKFLPSDFGDNFLFFQHTK